MTIPTGRLAEDSDDDDAWEPLDNTDDDPQQQLVQRTQSLPRQAYISNEEEGQSSSRRRRTTTTAAAASTHATRTRHRQNDSVRFIQSRLETKISLQSNLINHPIELLWKRFFINLARELWSLEWRIRVAIAMVITGMLTRIVLWSTWYIWYPRLAVLSVVLAASIVYLDPFHFDDHVKFIQKVVTGSPDEMIQALERWDLRQVRALSFALFLIPTILEIRTLSFLSQIKAEHGWVVYNVCIGTALFIFMSYLYKIRKKSPREAIYMGLLMLYGSALLVTLFTFEIRRIPHLAGPFLTATGTLLLTYRDQDMEWLSRLIRHTLRLTLRDVLSSVGERVAEDEMLQLAMLRWISDYWSYQAEGSSSPPSRTQQTSSTTSQNRSTSRPPPEPVTDDNYESAASSQVVSLASSVPRQQSSSEETNFRTHDVQWQELLPMLEISTNHMQTEYEALRQHTDSPNSSPGAINADDPTAQPHENNGFNSLKSMLMSLNVDDRAKPAVLAYKAAVATFPPRHRTAVTISIVRRCPALLTLFGSILIFQGMQSVITSIVILTPFIFMEYLRVLRWAETCQRLSQIDQSSNVSSSPSGSRSNMRHDYEMVWGGPESLRNVESMVILLSGDHHSVRHPPSLLMVWYNVVSSVRALEVGLTAARCIETTAITAEFAGNVISLVKFGLEVSERGWVHGLGVIINEVIHMREPDSYRDRKVTSAAVGAFHSGRRMGQSFNTLRADENVGTILQPFLQMAGLGRFIGMGGAPDNQSAFPQNDNEESTHTEEGPKQTENLLEQTEENNVPSDQEMRDKNASDALRAMNSMHAGSSIPSMLTIQEELSDIVDGVAMAYEQGLIEDEEKGAFLETLSRCSEDRILLKELKRSLQVVLDNGSMIPSYDKHSTDEVLPGAINGQLTGTTVTPTTATDTISRQEGTQEGTLQTEIISNPSENDDSRGAKDTWIKMGVAAVGVVAGGILLSMHGRGDVDGNTPRDANTSTNDEDNDETRGQSLTVQIEEIPDESNMDDEWTDISQ